jgi:hypothetical protein
MCSSRAGGARTRFAETPKCAYRPALAVGRDVLPAAGVSSDASLTRESYGAMSVRRASRVSVTLRQIEDRTVVRA